MYINYIIYSFHFNYGDENSKINNTLNENTKQFVVEI